MKSDRWSCAVCGNANASGANCANCHLPRGSRSYPAFDMATGKVVYGPSPTPPEPTPPTGCTYHGEFIKGCSRCERAAPRSPSTGPETQTPLCTKCGHPEKHAIHWGQNEVCPHCAAKLSAICADPEFEGRAGDMGEGHYGDCPFADEHWFTVPSTGPTPSEEAEPNPWERELLFVESALRATQQENARLRAVLAQLRDFRRGDDWVFDTCSRALTDTETPT